MLQPADLETSEAADCRINLPVTLGAPGWFRMLSGDRHTNCEKAAQGVRAERKRQRACVAVKGLKALDLITRPAVSHNAGHSQGHTHEQRPFSYDQTCL